MPSRPYHQFMLGKSTFEVDARYVNLRPIGRGAYGLVAAADDTLTGRKVAIKRVSRVFQDLIDAKRILREIKLLRHLSAHDNIIKIVDLMTGPPDCENFHTLYIVTQLFECDLDRIIMSSQKLSDQHAQYFLYQVLRGLKYIHSAGVLHRDLKPSNLLVNSNCDLCICDFGLARGTSAETVGDLTEYVVTRWYRGPELLCEAAVYGAPIDVWSVGCIFAEILGRKPMFRGSSTREQVELIIGKLGTPTADDLKGITSKPVLDAIRKIPHRAALPWTEMFPEASPLSLDLLSRMLVFDATKRITVEEILAHPYLQELHLRAREPVADTAFDFSFENGYPEEMPQALLQRHMFAELQVLRARAGVQVGNGGPGTASSTNSNTTTNNSPAGANTAMMSSHHPHLPNSNNHNHGGGVMGTSSSSSAAAMVMSNTNSGIIGAGGSGSSTGATNNTISSSSMF